MSGYPIGARVYVTLVIALGVLLLCLDLAALQVDEPARLLLFLLLSCLASAVKVTVPMPRAMGPHGLTMSLSFTVNFAALLVLGVHEATMIAAAGAWSQCTFNVRQKNPPHRTLFSVAAMALTLHATAWVYGLRGGDGVGWADELVSLTGAACAHFLVNSGLVAGAIALSARRPLSRVWTEHFLSGWVNQLLGALAAMLVARGIHQTGYWLVPMTALLLYVTYRTYRTYHARVESEQRAVQQLSDLHESTVEALALAIDAKGLESRTHLRRLQACSTALARAEGLGDPEVQAIKTAAMLHDIGMLAVPQHVMAKGGRPSDEELRKMRIHPQVGAEIIRDVPFPVPVAPIILAHHERWDGSGYPAGLWGEEIPLGARILAIADRFDALVSARRPGGLDEIAGVLRAEAGRAFDPRLVARFIGLLPQLSAQAGVAYIGAAAAPAATAGSTAARHANPTSNPFDDIALAHLEAHTLYGLAQALSACLTVADTMSTIASHLDALVPFTTCALFLPDEGRHITCRFASGPGASVLEPMRMPLGAGPVGWVVEHQRSLVNVSLVVGARNRSSAEPAFEGPEHALRSGLICPLVGDGGCLGALVVAHPDLKCYHDDDRRILEQVAEHVAAAIQNALRFERTHEAALTDRLTGLTNSRGLASSFDSAMGHAMAHAESLAVLMIDVDEFKTINDTYGHAAGDRALREVARVLAQSIRTRDVCARYAGDEFVLVLRGCGGAEAERRALELQMMFEAVRFAPEPGRLQALQISVGAAAYPADGPTLETLLVIADRRMYRDKSQRKRARAAVSASLGSSTSGAGHASGSGETKATTAMTVKEGTSVSPL